MREQLNNNPVVQAAVIGVLGLAVAFLVFTRVVNRGAETAATDPGATTTPDATSSSAPATTTPADSASTTPATGTDTAAPPADATAPADAPPAEAAAPTGGAFEPGPGLPKKVVAAHNDNKVVVLMVVRGNGSDDAWLQLAGKILGHRTDTEVFTVKAVDIAKYSRVTQGVDVERTPAMVVIEPKRLREGPLPRASVSYGYRGLQSAAQQIDNALYKGKDNLPYFPN